MFINMKAGSKQYWSPEMFTNLPYNGVLWDLYSWGIILFILTFGCWPFQQSSLQDLYFSTMVQNPVEFWKIHPETSRRISENNVSPDLIKLINYMLCPYPHFRLGIKQIRMQKWYSNSQFNYLYQELNFCCLLWFVCWQWGIRNPSQSGSE